MLRTLDALAFWPVSLACPPLHRTGRPFLLLVLAALGGCSGPPALLNMDGVGEEGGPYEKDVYVQVGVPAAFEGSVTNEGGTMARAPTLSYSDLACLTVEDDFAGAVGDGFAPGESHAFPLTITATIDCQVQTIVDWFIDADEGSSRGTFNVILQS